MPPSLPRRLAAETVGTAFLLVAVVGSGMMGERLAGGNLAMALLVNSLATGAVLVAIILAFGEVSGAHLNPAVTFAAAWERGLPWPDAWGYGLAQVAGAVLGVVVAHAMFGEPLVSVGVRPRTGAALWLSETVATFGLLAVIWGCVRSRSSATAFAVGAYITGACWFTSSASFANPAVTIARAFTNTVTGIRPIDVPPFVIVQFFGAFAATVLFGWLVPSLPARAADVVQPHSEVPMKKVIFACVHNAGRSQMAATWFNHLAQQPTSNAPAMTASAISAGTSPAERVHPEVIEVMKEVGIDLSAAVPRKLTEELASDADLLVTMGCGDECPYVPGLRVEDWPIEDPKGKPVERVREIRDGIKRRVEALLRQLS